MLSARNIVVAFMCVLGPTMSHGQTRGACDLPELMQQHQDEATIQQLEKSWNNAMSQGDSNFERCLLTADYREILHTGELKTLADELGLTAKNKGKNQSLPQLPRMTVLLHGNVAVAYATWKSDDPHVKGDQTADYFIWEDGLWHVFFSQATPVADTSHQSSSVHHQLL
jgi:hypothetical protein